MFTLTVIDHVRLDSEHVAKNYTLHARAADRLTGLAFWIRMTVAMLLATAAVASATSLMLQTRAAAITAAVCTMAALIVFALYAIIGVESKVAAHRAFAHRLWIVVERYRSLIAEAEQGIIDPSALVARRDQLIEQVHVIYQGGFAVDQSGFESARLPELASEQHAA